MWWLKYTKIKKEITMEELQKTLIAKIDEQLKSEKTSIQYLDVLNRLLGTVSHNMKSCKD